MAKYIPFQGEYGDTVWVNPEQVAVLWPGNGYTTIRIAGGTHATLRDTMIIREDLDDVIRKLTA